MNVSDALREGTLLLGTVGSEEVRLEAELLLMHALKTDRVHLYERLRDDLPIRAERSYKRFLDRRLAHEPTPYITGHKEFFGLELEVSRAALIPRPETETLVELAIEFANERYAGQRFTIADVGTGSGIIGVSVAQQLTNARVIATDVSRRALKLARRNAQRHGVTDRIEFVEGDVLRPIEEPVGIIAANLPYVRTDEWLATPPEIHEREPRHALDGGPDGLRYIRKLLRQAPDKLAPGGALFAEIGDRQGRDALSPARDAFPEANIAVRKDLAGLDRVLCAYT